MELTYPYYFVKQHKSTRVPTVYHVHKQEDKGCPSIIIAECPYFDWARDIAVKMNVPG